MDAKKFLEGIVYSLLPRRWWRGWTIASTTDFARSAILCGLLEMFLFATLTLTQFERHMVSRSKLVANVPMNAGTQLWVLAVFIADFLIQPLSLLLVYFTLEGFARAYTAWLHDAVLPSLPLYLLAKWQARREHRSAEKALGPRVKDVVERVSEREVRVLSCRPKDWTPSTTISFRQQMWELAGTAEIGGPRKYEYRLRLRSSNVAIRAIREYDPEGEDIVAHSQ